MSYDWHGELEQAPGSPAWYEEIDRRFIEGSDLFAHSSAPFDQVIPFSDLRGKRVLEIGCGMGLHTELLNRAGAEVISVDLTDAAVTSTATRLRLRRHPKRIALTDAENLPFPAGSFDFVWSWGVIHHSAHTGRIVREASRVLRPNGRMRAMVYNRSGTSARIIAVRDHILRGRFLEEDLDATFSRASDGSTARFYTRDQAVDLFSTFFDVVDARVYGLDIDVVPLPRRPRSLVTRLLPRSYMVRAQAQRGGFLFIDAVGPR